MRQSSAANVALILAVLAWPLTYYGVMSQLGDYHPDIPREFIATNRRVSVGILLTGLLCLLGSLWLSGYSFTCAKSRSIVAALICTGLIVFGSVGIWW